MSQASEFRRPRVDVDVTARSSVPLTAGSRHVSYLFRLKGKCVLFEGKKRQEGIRRVICGRMKCESIYIVTMIMRDWFVEKRERIVVAY